MTEEEKKKKAPAKKAGPKRVPAPGTQLRGLKKKLAAIQSALGRLPKRGYNHDGQYYYMMEADVLAAVSEQMTAHGVLLMHSIENVEVLPGNKTSLLVRIAFTWQDAHGKESHTFIGYGHGMDATDKALPKAITMATKYALLKQFLVGTDEDAEADAAEAQRAATHDRVGVDGANGQRNVHAPRADQNMGGKNYAKMLAAEWLRVCLGDEALANAGFYWMTNERTTEGMMKKQELAEHLYNKFRESMPDDMLSKAEQQLQEDMEGSR